MVALLVLSGCSLLPHPTTTEGASTPGPLPSATQSGPPPNSEIVTLTPEEVVPEDVYTQSEPNGTFPMGLDLPRGFPAGIPAFSNRWVKSNFHSFTNSEGRLSYGVMFVGDYDDVDTLLAEFARQGWSDEGSDELPTRRVYIVENETYRVIITATESAQTQGEPLDPTYNYTIVVL